ncbi:hypothetical protein [Silvibacterium dinghuense]|uniref:Uncharacterized protein n=1 Tax=Silvibacterium dinghuense TaxID=1560006 RepID=A0A4V1NW17_9BACT|nr:hypothetical protein [Silvibacterium dinghuense]RXS97862.1 hypothetical protein ESZ00_08385 [Silvibacterium dinghuense]
MIAHLRASVCERPKEVLVPENPKDPAHHAVFKELRRSILADDARMPYPDAELPCSPRHLLIRADDARGPAANRPELLGSTGFCLEVDAERELETAGYRGLKDGCGFNHLHTETVLGISMNASSSGNSPTLNGV